MSPLFLAKLRQATSSSSPTEVRTASCFASICNTFSSSLMSSDSAARDRSPDLTYGGWERIRKGMVEAIAGIHGIKRLCVLDVTSQYEGIDQKL